jgi:AraC-like DNA-binding protein/mannose-6-phosphate isomerase-like protein (cupin superfamily)
MDYMERPQVYPGFEPGRVMDAACHPGRGEQISSLSETGSPMYTEFRWESAFPILEPQINAEAVCDWPFDPSFPLDIRCFEFSHQAVRMNRHDFFELAFVCSGEPTFQIQDRLYPLKRGDLIVIGNSVYHRLVARTDGSKDRVLILLFKPELIQGSSHVEETGYLLPFFAQSPAFPYVIPADTRIPERIVELIREINGEMPPVTDIARLTMKTCLKMILVLLAKHFAPYVNDTRIFHQRQKALDRLRPLFNWIERRYFAPVAIEDAARICAMSPSYFIRFFKGTTGQSFHSYLNHFRVAKAEILLATTEKPISEISQDVGFCDQSYFGAVFRKLTNLTPATYRQQFLTSSKCA